MQAIITKYIAPTNFKPSRYSAACERGSITVSADHGLNADENHRAVCDALCARFTAEDVAKYGSSADNGTWSRPKAGGQIPDGRHVFCFIPPRTLERDQTELEKAAGAFMEQTSVANRSALRKILNKL